MVNTSIVLLLCLCPEVHAMFPNHAVVVFQPWTGNAPYLGSVDNYIFYSIPPAPPVSTNFLDIFNVPICPITPPWVFYLLVDPISCTCSPLPLLVWSTFHRSIARTLHLSSFAACFCTSCCESASSAVSHECVPPPPLPPSACYYHHYAQCYEIYSGHIFHWYLANENVLWCMDLQLDPQHPVRNIWYWDMFKVKVWASVRKLE